MALRGVKPEAIEKRLKMLLYGPPNVGKTTASLQFPKPYMIDCEKGAENDTYVSALQKSGGSYFQPDDSDDLIAEVTLLLSERHSYHTLVIDPLTVIYADLLDKSAQMLATKEDPTGTAFSRHKGPADRKMKHLLHLLTRLDMNVIITSHAKTKWEKAGKEIVDVGQTFDCYSKLDYLFDLVIELQKRGTERVGIVRKTRISGFPEGDIFPFSYDAIADRYGRTVLERDAVAVTLASAEQLATLRALLAERVNGEELMDKWMSKSMAETPEEMPAEAVAKCIAFLGGAPAPVAETETETKPTRAKRAA